MHAHSVFLRSMHKDLTLIFLSRILRLFGFGLTSVVLALLLASRGFDASQIGLLFTLTLLGDSVISLFLATRADRWGRRRTLIVSGFLMLAAGLLFEFGSGFWLLTLAATIGVISPGGGETGPFLAVEQAVLAQLVPAQKRMAYLAWYNVAGFSATAVGALAGGWIVSAMEAKGAAPGSGFSLLLMAYAVIGFSLMAMSFFLGEEIEANDAKIKPGIAKHWSGLHTSRPVVFKLSALFSLDAFAGGFIVQSILAYWFVLRFGLSEMALGQIFFTTNLLSGISALVAVPLAKRIGLINTMVFTHLPSNLLLIAVPLMPTAPLAVAALLARHFLSQMDVPTRQAYVMAVVPSDERSAANGITSTVRALASSLSPALAGKLIAIGALSGAPIIIAGTLKIAYDLALYAQFRSRPPLEE
ncbi:MAG: MFS transporter [Chthoniobacteraceae bacterium]